MKLFRTEDTIRFYPGAILGLSEDQATSRLLTGSIKAIKKGVFEVLKDVEIKRGETIGIEADVPKILTAKLTALEDKEIKKDETVGIDGETSKALTTEQTVPDKKKETKWMRRKK